jgi:hypothetical protein
VKKRNYLGLMAIALCSNMAFASPTEMAICTGGEGGFYEALGTDIGRTLSKTTGVKVEILNTGGSVDNAALMKDGDCAMAIIQADAVTSKPLPPDLKVVDAHTETVYWIFGKSGIDSFDKMEKDSVAKKYAFATVSGSGAEVTLKNWIETDKDYAGAVPVEFDDWYQAAEATAQGFVMKAGIKVEIAGMLYISRLGKITTDITEDFGQALVVGEIEDSSFQSSKDTNGNPLYVKCEINSKQTSGLRTSTFSDPDTYCLKAQVVYNNDWHQGDRKLRRAIDKSINGVVKAVR